MKWSTEIALLQSRGVTFERGLTDAELSAAEERVGCRFPPDLHSFLQGALPTGQGWPDWREPDSQCITDRLDWPADGIAFDITNNVFWWPAWGNKPSALADAIALMRERVGEAPKLIPICRHVYLSAEPGVAGNPALSVYQTDIIYGGRDLGEYLRRILSGEEWPLPRCDEVRRIRFWSELIEWNDGCI